MVFTQRLPYSMGNNSTSKSSTRLTSSVQHKIAWWRELYWQNFEFEENSADKKNDTNTRHSKETRKNFPCGRDALPILVQVFGKGGTSSTLNSVKRQRETGSQKAFWAWRAKQGTRASREHDHSGCCSEALAFYFIPEETKQQLVSPTHLIFLQVLTHTR